MPGAEQIIFFTKDCLSWILRRLVSGVELILAVCECREPLRMAFKRSTDYRLSSAVDAMRQPYEYWSIIIGDLLQGDSSFITFTPPSTPISIPNICACNLSFQSFSPYGHRAAIERHTPKKSTIEKKKSTRPANVSLFIFSRFVSKTGMIRLFFRSDDGKSFVLLIFIFRSLL